MPHFNVRLHFSDETEAVDLEVYQRVHCAVGTPREAIVQCAKQQFLNWTRQRGADWAEVGARLPSADVSASEVLPAGDGTVMLR